MEAVQQWLAQIKAVLEIPLIKLGETQVTLWMLLYLILLVVLLFYLSGKLKNLIVVRLLARSHIDLGVRQAMGMIVRYFVIAIGFVIILQTVGIDLTALNVLAGAVGIGLGFGLKNVIDNFFSGLIILFERPIKVGDRIEVGNVLGNVLAINVRSTTVITNDRVVIIVPNSKFIAENVINWSYSERSARFRIPVTVAYGSDVRLVERLLLEAAHEVPEILHNPPPSVRFLEFLDSGIYFELRAWSEKLLDRKGKLTSLLNFAIYEKFNANGIVFPYPQREIYIKSGHIDVRKVE
jgi:small-conductance mechanosensitive channel